jgi:hypothetical protein
MTQTDVADSRDLEVQAWLSLMTPTHAWDLLTRRDRNLLEVRYGLGHRRGNTFLSVEETAKAFNRASWRVRERLEASVLALACFDRLNADSWPSYVVELMLAGSGCTERFCLPSRDAAVLMRDALVDPAQFA